MMKPFLGIAFGGGGVRGAAHVGVLQELHKAGITADIVSGVSAGSIVAGMYAMSLDPFKLENKFREIWKTHDFQKSSKSIFFKQKKKINQYQFFWHISKLHYHHKEFSQKIDFKE